MNHRNEMPLLISRVLLCVLFGCVCMSMFVGDVEAAKRPNILWIIGEDFGPELSCYGHQEVWTPNIDKLAAEGTRYTKAFTVTPVCSTSRSSFMTGMYAFSINAHNHRSNRSKGSNPLPDGVRVITQWLQGAGYYTSNLVQFPNKQGEIKFRGTGKTDWNFQYDAKHGPAYETKKYVDLKSHQPFYAQVNFSETHRGREWNNAHKIIDKLADPAKVKIPPYYPDHPIARKDWAQYLNTAMALDKKVGLVIKRLKEDKLLEDTVVIFFGDHGRAHVRGKQHAYDSGLHVPLIIRWPKNFERPKQLGIGKVDDRLIASIDISATTLAIAGVKKPAKMQGRVFLGERAEADREYVFAGRDRGDETVDRVRTVRDKQFRYMRNFYPKRGLLQLNRYKEWSYPMLPLMRRLHAEGKLNAVQAKLFASTRAKEELYDLVNDPYEINNLAGSEAHQEVLMRLRKQVEDWIVRIDDKGRVPESKEVIKKNEEQMKKYYKRIFERHEKDPKHFPLAPELQGKGK